MPWLLAAALLAQMAVAMLGSAANDAPTNDEPEHLGAAVGVASGHDTRWGQEHPPLVRLVAGLALRASDVSLPEPTSVQPFDARSLGHELLYREGNEPDNVLWIARLPMVLFGLGVAALAGLLARDLFGPPAGLLTLALVAFCPNVIAHARLVTTDVPVVALLLATLWTCCRAERAASPRCRNGWLVATGAAFGLALTAKFLALLFVPVIAVLVLASADGRPRHRARALAVVGVVTLAVLWAVYLLADPRLRWAAPEEGLPLLTSALPLPRPYLAGLAEVLDLAHRDSNAFLLGHRFAGGAPAYYPVVLAIKTPLPTLALWVTGVVAVLRGRRRRPVALYVLLPAAYLLVIGIPSDVNLGVRHMLLVPVLLAVAAGAVLTAATAQRLVVVGVLVALLATSSVAAAPHYLAYANEAFGGWRRAHEVVSDSNVDWGQDLRRLAGRLQTRYARETQWLLYFGTADPRAHGVRARDVRAAPRQDVHGVVAVSASIKNGAEGPGYDWITQGRDPIDQVGGSILIYRVP